MKKWLPKLLKLCLLALIVWFAWGYFFPSETQRICKRLNSFSRAVSFASGSSLVIRMAKADGARDYFATNVVVTLDGVHTQAESIIGRAEVMNIISLAHTFLQELDLKFEDPIVKVSSDKTRATMDVIGRIIIDESRRDRVHQLLRMKWIKTNDKWRIERVETLKMLGRETGTDYVSPFNE
jgi:hypothetical protein